MDAPIFSLMPIEAFQDKRLTLTHLRVLGALMSFRSKNTDLVWPSRREIAKRCGLLEHKISTATTELVALGWMEKEGKGGFSKATRYRITVPELGTVDATETVPDSGTVNRANPSSKTVPDSGTVPKSGTVPDSGTRPVPDSGTPMPVPESGTRKEHNQEQTNGTDQRAIAGLNLPAWDEYLAYRRQSKFRKLKPASVEKLQEWLVEQGPPDTQQQIVDQTIRNNWQGLFPLKGEQHGNQRQESRSKRVADKLDEIARRDIAQNGFTGTLD